MASSLMASQALTLRSHSSLSFRNPTSLHLPPPPKHLLLKPTNLTLKKSRISSSSPIPTNPNPTHFPLTDSTRTITTLLAITLSLSKTFANKISHLALKFKAIISTPPTPNDLSAIKGLQQSLVCSVGPLFFAAMKDQSSGYLNTPLTVVAAGMAKWLDIYSGVLMVRVLLSWFPNIPWDRQPLSAIRDLCDPYLNLFRNIIPPIFDTLDVSPLLAFAVLGTLGSILNSSRGAY